MRSPKILKNSEITRNNRVDIDELKQALDSLSSERAPIMISGIHAAASYQIRMYLA